MESGIHEYKNKSEKDAQIYQIKKRKCAGKEILP